MKSEGGTGGVIVMSPPMMMNGHGAGAAEEGCVSIPKERLKGQAPLLYETKCGFSVSNLDVGRMYYAVAKTGCRPSAYLLRMKL